MTVEVSIGGRRRLVELAGNRVVLDGRPLFVDVASLGAIRSLILGSAETPTTLTHGRSHEVIVLERASGDFVVQVDGTLLGVEAARAGSGQRRLDRGPRASAGGMATGPLSVVAPMPGRVARVLVRVGDTVAPRQGLVVVEAMKMENELRAPRAGTVIEVRAREGARVEAHAVLVVIDE